MWYALDHELLLLLVQVWFLSRGCFSRPSRLLDVLWSFLCVTGGLHLVVNPPAGLKGLVCRNTLHWLSVVRCNTWLKKKIRSIYTNLFISSGFSEREGRLSLWVKLYADHSFFCSLHFRFYAVCAALMFVQCGNWIRQNKPINSILSLLCLSSVSLVFRLLWLVCLCHLCMKTSLDVGPWQWMCLTMEIHLSSCTLVLFCDLSGLVVLLSWSDWTLLSIWPLLSLLRFSLSG